MSYTNNRRSADTIKNWASILGPVIGLAFGFGVAKASLEGTMKQHAERIAKLEGHTDSIDATVITKDGIYSVGLTKVNEQVASINRRLDRMEDVQERILYSLTGAPKQQRRQ